MKRILILVLMLLTVWMSVSCAETSIDTSTPTDTTTTTGKTSNPVCTEHVLGEATCTSPARCTICKRPVGTSLGHTWEGENCMVCGEKDPLAVKTPGLTRVVCIGDSITKGGYWANNLAGNLSMSSYEVIGLGVNGATGLAAGIDCGNPKAYIDQNEHALAKRYNPDIVVIMLGTNDSKPCNYQSIKTDAGEQFYQDMVRLIEEYKALAANPQIFVALPATAYNDRGAFEGISEASIVEYIIPALRRAAEATGATVIDTHTATANAAEHFPDGVHPGDDIGRGLLAKAVADAILAVTAEEKE